MNQLPENLLFYYSSKEFSKKFLPLNGGSPLNTYLSVDGNVNILYTNDGNHYLSYCVSSQKVLQDLKDEHQAMQDDKYKYKIAFTSVELSHDYNDQVFIRVEKSKKEGI